jgi:hypothetical protein
VKRPPSPIGRWLRFLATVWSLTGRDMVRERQAIRRAASQHHTLNHWKG